jgi:hypothetical protein
MRSSEPIPGDPWPHDMVISIEEHDFALLRLLFVREAWQLSANDVPALSGPVDIGASRLPTHLNRNDASARWNLEWSKSWQRFDEHDRRVHPMGPAERLRLDAMSDEEVNEVYSLAPSRYWAEGVDDPAFTQWRDAQIRRTHLGHLVPLNEHPERRSLSALISAWESGLTRIVQLPYEGYVADRISRQCLVVSEQARHDAVLYDKALSEPPRI